MKQPFDFKKALVGDIVYTPSGIKGVIKSTDRDNIFYPIEVVFDNGAKDYFTREGYLFASMANPRNYRLYVEVEETNIRSLRESFEALQKKTDELINQLHSLLNDLQQNITENGKEIDNDS